MSLAWKPRPATVSATPPASDEVVGEKEVAASSAPWIVGSSGSPSAEPQPPATSVTVCTPESGGGATHVSVVVSTEAMAHSVPPIMTTVASVGKFPPSPKAPDSSTVHSSSVLPVTVAAVRTGVVARR